MLLAFSEVNHVIAFSVKVLGKALHNMASSLETILMADLYLHMCSWGFVLPLYRTNWRGFKFVSGRTSLIHFSKGPILKAFLIISDPRLTEFSSGVYFGVILVGDLAIGIWYSRVLLLLYRRRIFWWSSSMGSSYFITSSLIRFSNFTSLGCPWSFSSYSVWCWINVHNILSTFSKSMWLNRWIL